jgi:hypothetical protein
LSVRGRGGAVVVVAGGGGGVSQGGGRRVGTEGGIAGEVVELFVM